jgi:hypothetical protein
MRRTLYVSLAIVTLLIMASCVSPFYNTAEVTKGEKSLYIGAGPSLVTEKYFILLENQYSSWDTTIAVRLDLQPVWGISDRFALTGNLGASVSIKKAGELVPFGKLFYPSIKIGMQYEFIENPSIAMRLDLGSPFPLTFSLLGGIYIQKLNREIATLGLNLSLDGPLSAGPQGWSPFPFAPTLFADLRPLKRLCIYAGATLYPRDYESWNWYERAEYSLGIGYRIF